MKNLMNAFNSYATGTLSFRALTRADAFPMHVATQNPEFNARLLWGPPEDFSDVLEQIDKLVAEHEQQQIVALSICERDNGKWVGLIKFGPFQDTMMMSIWIHPDYWRTMAAFRCAETTIDILFRHTDLPHLYGAAVEGNKTMEKMMSTNGFVSQGFIPMKHSKGHFVTCELFKLERINWTRKPKTILY